jgi:pimeloyl-ACP methyl ester carboxylesterase
MATFVLVPGAWLGGWAWEAVTARLRNAGHEVYPVSLTGLGERADLAAPSVDLDTYIADVADLLEEEDLRDAVLVGHSFAGMVVTGAAERVPSRLAQLVYVDSGPFPDGTAFLDTMSPPARELTERLIEEQGEGWRWPMPSWDELENVMEASLAGLGERERAAMRAGAVPQPSATLTQALRRTQLDGAPVPKVLVSSSFPLGQVRRMIVGGHPWFRELAGPEWRLLEVPTGHWPMFSAPEELARALDGIAAT